MTYDFGNTSDQISFRYNKESDPLDGGVSLDVSLAAGDNKIFHSLNSTPRGYIIIDCDQLNRTKSTSKDNRSITIYSEVNCNARIVILR